MAESPAPTPAQPVRSIGSSQPGANAIEDQPLDIESKKGRFGWCTLDKSHIPYVFRSNRENKFTSVRIVERQLINRFLSVLPPEINSCYRIPTSYVTEAEWRLLNEINLKHNDCPFGKDPFTVRDILVSLSDATEIYQFLNFCSEKLALKQPISGGRCGFFCVNGESVIPYVAIGDTKLLPLFYFEGETEDLEPRATTVQGWDLVKSFP